MKSRKDQVKYRSQGYYTDFLVYIFFKCITKKTRCLDHVAYKSNIINKKKRLEVIKVAEELKKEKKGLESYTLYKNFSNINWYYDFKEFSS